MWLLLLATSIFPCISNANTLDVDTPVASEGYFVLSWQTSNITQIPGLQQSSSASFTEAQTRAIPSDGILTITGLPDGEYYFRLVDGELPLTDPLRVIVQHHDLNRAGLFFTIGLLLFITLVVTILRGASLGESDHDG